MTLSLSALPISEMGAAEPSSDTLDCLAALVGFDTTSRKSNLALIDWAAERLRSAGAKVRLSFNADRTKANLFASFGRGEGGVVLSGHTDVVPVDDQQWSTDPFVATVRDGRVYGRGACDMKGFIAVVLAQAEAFGRTELREPLHVALTYDEEVGCLGVPGLLVDLSDAGIHPSGCIVGEPTEMRLVGAHKGGRIYHCRVRGCAAHASLPPKAVNAIEYAARLIAYIQDLAEAEEASGVRDDAFDVPYTTLATNTIVGGTAANIIPAHCDFQFEYRFLPGLSPDRFIDAIRLYADESLLPRMRSTFAQASIDFECIGSIPALDSDAQQAIHRLAAALLGQDRASKVAYGTEASFFHAAGIPSVVCGPGSIDQAHKADEYVTLDQLRRCEHFIARLLRRQSV